MKTDQHKRKHLKDYQPPSFEIINTRLVFHLDESRTRVISSLQLQRKTSDKSAELVLDGIELELIELRVDGDNPYLRFAGHINDISHGDTIYSALEECEAVDRVEPGKTDITPDGRYRLSNVTVRLKPGMGSRK